MNRLSIPLPQRMRTLQRDGRGYPIPFIVLRDKSGTPQFTINDHRAVAQCRSKHLCSICGKRFERHPVTFKNEMWFIGGSRCFLHEHGAFLDPPLHYECAEYALRVCPFLAARRYTGRIDAAKLRPEDTPEDMVLVREAHVMPHLPERFGLGMTNAYYYRERPGDVGIFIVDDWRYVEWWRNGEPCEAPDTGIAPPIQEIAG